MYANHIKTQTTKKTRHIEHWQQQSKKKLRNFQQKKFENVHLICVFHSVTTGFPSKLHESTRLASLSSTVASMLNRISFLLLFNVHEWHPCAMLYASIKMNTKKSPCLTAKRVCCCFAQTHWIYFQTRSKLRPFTSCAKHYYYSYNSTTSAEVQSIVSYFLSDFNFQ